MPGSLMDDIVLRDFVLEDLSSFTLPAQQRILVVTDGALSFSPQDGFGLSRLVATLQSYSPQPIITLAHRSLGNHTVVIGSASLAVIGNFKFDTASIAVTVANYDQIWLFGYRAGPGVSNVQPLTGPEINRLGTFMNAGGGVFATGDHATLGQGMGGELPRIRHMRDWATIPMGNEGKDLARNRIDTIVNPGSDGIYEFVDQSDSIPQRIYPNYRVAWTGAQWAATIHPLLSMPGALASRTEAQDFANDMDVLPDHPHESVCLEASAAALNGTYNAHGLNFREFPEAIPILAPPNAGLVAPFANPVRSEIVAYGVSGGRAIELDGLTKPPVNPRTFGIISAFNGHAGERYPGAPTAPGRIVCDSTWHHFVNVNIDGTSTDRNGLGTRPFGLGIWVPSRSCQKIFQYYRNIITYLIPLNRRLPWLLHQLVAVQLHPSLIEEMVQVGSFADASDFEGLGAEVAKLLDFAHGRGTAVEAVRSALRLEESMSAIADSGEEDYLVRSDGGPSPIVAYTLGKAAAQIAKALPFHQPDQLKKALKRNAYGKIETELVGTIATAAAEAVERQADDAERRLKQLRSMRHAMTGPQAR